MKIKLKVISSQIRTDAFELWCWRRLWRVPWTARRSNQSILREINPEYYWKDWCWSWNSNTLATWCKEPTHWKDPDAGEDWRQEKKGMPEDEMVGWHHPLNGFEFEQTLEDSEEQWSLAFCSPWGRKESDTTELLKWTDNCSIRISYDSEVRTNKSQMRSKTSITQSRQSVGTQTLWNQTGGSQ